MEGICRKCAEDPIQGGKGAPKRDHLKNNLQLLSIVNERCKKYKINSPAVLGEGPDSSLSAK